MTDGPDVPGEWDPSGQAEPPAALLRRAISHVEQLLQRLERPGAPVEGAGEAASMSRPMADLGMGTTVESVPSDDTGAIEPVLNNPVRRISSAAQAEALRVSLNAHEKANRLLAEASAIRAQSASEGEQILVEARELADRMQNEATEEAGLYVNRAREDAESLVNQAAAEMQRVREAALEESERLRGEATAEAQQMLESATAESDRLRAEAEAEAQQVRASAAEESERVRTEARAEADALRNDAGTESRQVTEAARAEADALRSDAEQLRESVQQEADRLLSASSEEAQRLRDLAQQDAERIRSEAENQARIDREAADAAIREVLDGATADAEQIRAQAREEGQAEAARLIEARVEEAAAAARAELEAEKVRVYELLGYANDSVAEVRTSMRDLIEALGTSMGTINGATGSMDALMARLRDAAHEHGVEVQGPPADSSAHDDRPSGTVHDISSGAGHAQREAELGRHESYSENIEVHESAGDDADGGEPGEEGRRPLGLLFGASHKSRASKR